jgi:hypothetical protein
MRMSGAVLSTGWRATVTLQYSPMEEAPVPDGGTTAASVTSPPVVGRPMTRAGTATPNSSAHPLATSAALAGAAQPSEATTARTTPAAAVLILVRCMGLASFHGGLKATMRQPGVSWITER